MDNKNTYFLIKFLFKNDKYKNSLPIEQLLLTLEEKLDLFLTNVGATEETYKIYNLNEINSIEILFKTKIRKRVGVIKNSIRKIVKPIIETELQSFEDYNEKLTYLKDKLNNPYLETCIGCKKSMFDDRFTLVLTNTNKYTVKSESKLYDGKDIAVFNNKEKYYSWQKTLTNLIFEQHGGFKEAHDREIIFIEDKLGNSGKSSFFKYWYTKHGDDIGILSEATASQLRSNIIKLGKRRLYIIDLPRTESELGVKDLINAIEVLKGGFLNSSFFGRGDTRIMNPPHIIVAGNYLPSGSISPDRWKVLTLIKEKDDITCKETSKEKQKEASEEIEEKVKRKLLIKKFEKYKTKILEKRLKNIEKELQKT